MEPSFFILSEFPDFNSKGFNIDTYNEQFKRNNSIISARSKNIYYKKHWGGLSVKLAFDGVEYYNTENSKYAVNESNFLILNNNTEYSSFIDSDTEVESFTLNLCQDFVRSVIESNTGKSADDLDADFSGKDSELHFMEKTYSNNQAVFLTAGRIRDMLSDFKTNEPFITELFGELLLQMISLNGLVIDEIENVKKLKVSTRQELYKRLNFARDFMESCFDQHIDLTKIARVACLNREYFIRQFKIYYGKTPAQYLIHKRMVTAEKLLTSSEIPVSEVCQMVGYSDLTSFGKLFRKYYKTNPENYRLAFQKNYFLKS